mgnify:FL=1
MKTLTLLVAAAASVRRDLGIDLGRQVTDWSSETCAVPSPPKKMKTEYPRLHLYDAPEATWEMPGEGTALITYRVTSREKREEEENGVKKMKHSIGLEIIDIDPKVKGKGKKKGEDNAGEDGVMDFGSLLSWCRELRLRDENGVFVPSSAGLADPAPHAAAYDPPGSSGRAQRLARVRSMILKKRGRTMTPEEAGRGALM